MAAISNAASIVECAHGACLAAHAVEDPVVSRQRAGVAGGGLRAAGGSALDQHHGRLLAHGAQALEELPASVDRTST
ncbi:MAG: hypothetical protein R2699_06815 [Acidimicrobiales bacterium]